MGENHKIRTSGAIKRTFLDTLGPQNLCLTFCHLRQNFGVVDVRKL